MTVVLQLTYQAPEQRRVSAGPLLRRHSDTQNPERRRRFSSRSAPSNARSANRYSRGAPAGPAAVVEVDGVGAGVPSSSACGRSPKMSWVGLRYVTRTLPAPRLTTIFGGT